MPEAPFVLYSPAGAGPAAQAAKEMHTLREERFRKLVRVGVQLATGGRAPVVFPDQSFHLRQALRLHHGSKFSFRLARIVFRGPLESKPLPCDIQVVCYLSFGLGCCSQVRTQKEFCAKEAFLP